LGHVSGFALRDVVSVALRVAIHSYQGPIALIGILPMTIVFTWYYARSGRLSPVVVAHVITDAAGLDALAAARR
jgi:membrane protease YdiL (CAAX protease family)